MGCPVSKPGEQNGDVVALCRERKRLIKSVVDRRFALAEAHCKYNQSLYSVALAIRMFVTKHSSPSSPFLPTNKTLESNSMYLQSQDSPVSSLSSLPEREKTEVISVTEYENGGDDQIKVDPPMPQPSYSFWWDFFDMFDEFNGFDQSYGTDDPTAMRDAEENVQRENRERKIVGMEEVKQSEVRDGKIVGNANVSQGEQMGLRVIDEGTNGMELLEALKNVDDYFIRVYESGFDLCKILEANVVHPQSGLEENKESLKKITWRKSTSSRSSRSSSTCMESDSDVSNECGGMESGIHSSTLGILYAWEKKLYEQAKAGHEMRKIYERKCSHLSKKEFDGFESVEKTKAEIRSLYSKILVTMRSADSISKRIQEIIDQELQPQLLELLHGLMRTWKVIFESHKAQSRTMSQAKYLSCNFMISGSNRLSTLQLETEHQKWRTCFSNYVFIQKSYVQALTAYLSKSVIQSENEPSQIKSPSLIDICHDWLNLMTNLPDKTVTDAMKSFAKDIRGLWVQQGVEEQHNSRVDGLITELERRERVLEFKTNFQEKSRKDLRHKVECIEEKKALLVKLKNRVDEEKLNHQEVVQQTTRVGLHAFQSGFSLVFESLDEFSRACVDMYSVLVASGENAKEMRKKVLKLNKVSAENEE